ncbi:MAG: hypothetical protein K2Q17_07440 [Nitrospiraceae bacterium]|nr:hypothetical protein [Nitrospiraceae bacterium]
MRLIHSRVAWSRVVVLVWASVWMLAAPLVHIHPEADHRHGAEDHTHGGTVHTVFSSNLPCEFSVYNHASVADDESRCPLHLIAQPLHGLEHFEIDMVLASSAEPQVGKGAALDVAAHFSHAPPPARLHAVWQPHTSPSLTNLFLTTSLSSRAPPLV